MKCVIVVDHTLAVGLIANTSAVFAMSIGNRIDGIIGEDAQDMDGALHRGITWAVVPVLKGDGVVIRTLRNKLHQMGKRRAFFRRFLRCGPAVRGLPRLPG